MQFCIIFNYILYIVFCSWFFEGCSREAAESILTIGKKYGNVLMRESVTFRSTQSYVISMRREVAG